MRSAVLDLTPGERKQRLRKRQGLGTGRRCLSFVAPAPWPHTKHQQRSLARSKEQEAILQGGREEGSLFQMRLSILDDSISS